MKEKTKIKKFRRIIKNSTDWRNELTKVLETGNLSTRFLISYTSRKRCISSSGYSHLASQLRTGNTSLSIFYQTSFVLTKYPS